MTCRTFAAALMSASGLPLTNAMSAGAPGLIAPSGRPSHFAGFRVAVMSASLG